MLACTCDSSRSVAAWEATATLNSSSNCRLDISISPMALCICLFLALASRRASSKGAQRCWISVLMAASRSWNSCSAVAILARSSSLDRSSSCMRSSEQSRSVVNSAASSLKCSTACLTSSSSFSASSTLDCRSSQIVFASSSSSSALADLPRKACCSESASCSSAANSCLLADKACRVTDSSSTFFVCSWTSPSRSEICCIASLAAFTSSSSNFRPSVTTASNLASMSTLASSIFLRFASTLTTLVLASSSSRSTVSDRT
mmetsp:Transcript_84645/g.273630  ORF Transcript_84645/g.273630 Transcript_84645/m.273630 type:complete len:261 (+) Transcript_84645:1494-2276(+)